MKSLLIGSALLVSTLAANATLVLVQGESYEYQFDGLPFAFTVWRGLGAGVGGEVRITLGTESFDPSGLRIEMFENPDSSSPFFEGFGTRDGIAIRHFENYRWTDSTGKVRLTALSGNFEITNVQLTASVSALRNGKVDIDFYQRNIDPVPEPGTGGLMLIGGLSLVGYLQRRRRSKHLA